MFLKQISAPAVTVLLPAHQLWLSAPLKQGMHAPTLDASSSLPVVMVLPLCMCVYVCAGNQRLTSKDMCKCRRPGLCILAEALETLPLLVVMVGLKMKDNILESMLNQNVPELLSYSRQSKE